ncbi:tudor domain-containing protein 7B [Galendromus occidentalis]|uniref:Tudor domain-containing protein 7B n=1 Tax=Galendromus occidentalis TaxID=34638 RepID=A0AAJ7WJ78_9ACAR|nr:tudor domain-containing protein 7B [Galendromus occidentalis]
MEGVELSNNLRNLLQSTKGGIPLKRLDAEFYTFSGVHIPLGAYKDLEDLLKTMPDVCHIRNNDRGQAMVFSLRPRGGKTATVIGAGSSPAHRTKRAPPRNPTRAPQANNSHHAPKPRTGPSGRLPRRLPQSKQQHSGRGNRNQLHGNNASNGNWRSNGRSALPSGQNGEFNGRRGNMVWINPSIQYVATSNGSSSSGNHSRSSREYRDRPNAIPIVDPRSRRVVSHRHEQHQPAAARTVSPKGLSSSIAILKEYARATSLPAPEFHFMESKTNKKAATAEFLCTVELDGKKYKSYPDYRPTAELARESAAAKALAALGITKDNLQQRVAEKQATLPFVEMTNPQQIESVAVKLVQMLEKRPNGVFCNSVPQIFAEDFKEKLPEDWRSKINEHKQLDFVTNALAKTDVLYKKDTVAPTAPQVPPLTISDEQFMFVITYVVDVHNFYGRVEREEYHTLTTEMEAYYKEEANLTSQKLEASDKPVVGALYAVFDESWHRVQCVMEENGTEAAEFRYVDLGITESIPREKLMHLAYDFYSVPFSSIQLRLEEFDDTNVSDSKRPSVIAEMERLMQNKILWAVPTPDCDVSVRPLPVKVYDTGDDSSEGCQQVSEGSIPRSRQSSQIDINTEIYKVVATPVIFPAPVIAKGYLSCVSPDGTIYLQIEDFGLNELRSLTVEPASDECVKTVQPNRVYCAQLEGNWYRCVATNIVSDNEIDIEFIDYGNKDTVSIDKMFPLKMGYHLEDLPAQAVRAHMTDLQPETMWSEDEIAKITDFCPEDQMLIIKVSAATRCQDKDCDESIQHVDVFKRTMPNDELVSVNLKLCEELSCSASADQNGHTAGDDTEVRPLVAVYPENNPPEQGSVVNLHVVSAASPLKIICQPFNTLGELANLRATMQLFYGKQENRLKTSELVIRSKEFYACLQDEIWERAYVEKAPAALNESTSLVCYFVDNGAYMSIPAVETSIQPLHEQFRQLPFQAIQAQMQGVGPKKGACDFDPMDCITFQKHITGRDLEAKVCGYTPDSRITVAPTFSLVLELFDDDDEPLRDVYAKMELFAIC